MDIDFSLLHWLIFAVLAFVLVGPLWRILPRAGMHPALALLAILPFGAPILWCVLGFKRWPGDA